MTSRILGRRILKTWSSTGEVESLPEQHQEKLSHNSLAGNSQTLSTISDGETKRKYATRVEETGGRYLVLRSAETKRRTQVASHLVDRKGLRVSSILMMKLAMMALDFSSDVWYDMMCCRLYMNYIELEAT